MFISGTIANSEILSSNILLNITYKENVDYDFLNKIEEVLDELNSENLILITESIMHLYKQILGNYDEKIMIDGQIYTLNQLVQLQITIQNEQPLDSKHLQMLYLSIYQMDQQLQKERYVPIFLELTKEFGYEFTAVDLTQPLVFAPQMTGKELVDQLSTKFNKQLPKAYIEKLVKEKLQVGAKSIVEIESSIEVAFQAIQQSLNELQHTTKIEERLEILNSLPIERFKAASNTVQQAVVEKIPQQELTLVTLQKMVILETLRTEKQLRDEEAAKQEKTIQEQLKSIANTILGNDSIVTEITL